MWNSKGFDGGFGSGNDFGGTQSQFASPITPGPKKERRAQNLVPITIKTICDSEDDTIRIEDTEVHMVCIIGLIKTVDITSTKITYLVDDTTGSIEAVQWLESENDVNEEQRPMMEMTYCRINGSVRSQQGRRYIMIFKIEPITNLNRLTTHILEVIHSALKLKKIHATNGSGVGASNNEMSSSMLGTSSMGGLMPSSSTSMASSYIQGLKGPQKLVYQVIENNHDEEGLSRMSIHKSLTGKLGPQAVDQVIEVLCNEGHIYCTIDEDHFKITDS